MEKEEDSETLITHQTRSTQQQQLFSCRTCNQEFEKSSALYWHRRKQHSSVRHRCSICDKTFLQAGGLETHMRVQHVGQRAFECPLCSAAFAHSSLLYQHYRTHERRQQQQQQQQQLDNASNSVNTRVSTQHAFVVHHHHHNPHHVNRHCQGNEASSSSASRSTSENDSTSNAVDAAKPYNCDECERAFASQSGLRRHRKRCLQDQSVSPTRNISIRKPKKLPKSSSTSANNAIAFDPSHHYVVLLDPSSGHVMEENETNAPTSTNSEDPMVAETIVI